MSESSAIDPGRLSLDQEALLGPYRDYWKRVRNSTAPADRAAAELGVTLAYAAAGLDPPQKIVWCNSPVAIERLRKATWHTYDPGPSVKSLVVDRMVHTVGAWIGDNLPVRMRVAAATGLEFESQYFATSAVLRDTLAEEIARVKWSLAARGRALIARLTRKQTTRHTSFAECRWLQHEGVGFLARCAFLHNVCGTASETSALHGLWQVATNAGAMVPHERICWMSERHDTLAVDGQGRLHNSTGPAVRYPDGWSIYAWKGVRVPRWMIEEPDQIGLGSIERERDPVIRHCMIDIMTPEKYIATGAPTRYAQDAVGTLWRMQWFDWQDAWAAVEVVNGTPEADGTMKHYFLQVPPNVRTPTEAVAWTYGMTAKRYAALCLRT